MRVGIYRTVGVVPGCSIIFEHLMDGYADEAAPTCMFRAYMRSPSNDQLYTVHEEYESEEAWRAYDNAPHTRHWRSALLRVVIFVSTNKFELRDEHELDYGGPR